MSKRQKVALFWSGGKDAALALFKLQQNPTCEVVSLVSTFSHESGRLTMHGVDPTLIRLQAKRAGLELTEMWMNGASNEAYEEKFIQTLNELKEKGVDTVAFGDIALEDLKIYRERLISQTGLSVLFPLWKTPTSKIITEIEEANIKSVICCLNKNHISTHFLGKTISIALTKQFNNTVDPAGENGEYHSFCIDAPYFKAPISVSHQEIRVKTYPVISSSTKPVQFAFLELLQS